MESRLTIRRECPWCTTEPEDHDEGRPLLRAEFMLDAVLGNCWAVCCETCGAHGPTRETEGTAISAWNDRGETPDES